MRRRSSVVVLIGARLLRANAKASFVLGPLALQIARSAGDWPDSLATANRGVPGGNRGVFGIRPLCYGDPDRDLPGSLRLGEEAAEYGRDWGLRSADRHRFDNW